jgi:hypothetical protein
MAIKVVFSKADKALSDVTVTPPAGLGLVESFPVPHQGQAVVASVFSDEPVGATFVERVSMTVEADDAVVLPVLLGRDAKVQAIKVFAPTALVSTLGTITLAVSKSGSANMLASATFDVESLSSGVAATLTLTGTEANLELDEDDFIRFTLTSSNADADEEPIFISTVYSLT